jgi:hypothetical protein
VNGQSSSRNARRTHTPAREPCLLVRRHPRRVGLRRPVDSGGENPHVGGEIGPLAEHHAQLADRSADQDSELRKFRG